MRSAVSRIYVCILGRWRIDYILAMNKTITLLIIGVIFLALLLMMLNSFTMEERHGASPPLAEKPRSQESVPRAPVPADASAPAPILAPSVPKTQISPALAPAIPKISPQPAESVAAERTRTPSAEDLTVATVPSQIDAGQAALEKILQQTVAPSHPAPPKAPDMPEPNARQTSGGNKNITNIVVYATQEGATLRLGGDQPLLCTPMLLRNPDRLVLDFEGQWNVNVPGVPPNKIVKAIRVGRQADATRMVIDLHRAPASYRLVPTSPRGLDVRLR